MSAISCTAILIGCTLLPAAAQTSRDTARRLLDGAIEMSTAVHPETATAAFMRAGITYAALDKKTALGLLQRAFSMLASVANEDVREEYATAIVRAVADLDLRSASALLAQLPKPAPATTAVVRQMLAAKDFDDAMELLAVMPAEAEYPHEAASHLIAWLPQNDPRRIIAFGRATAAFTRVPVGPFPALVERYAGQMPAELRAQALTVLLGRIEAWKDVTSSISGTGSDDEPEIEIQSNSRRELREIVAVARTLDPAAVDRIVAQRAEIAAALAGFRRPRRPAEAIAVNSAENKTEDDEPFSPPFGIGMAADLDSFRREIGEYTKAAKQAQRVSKALASDPSEAVRLARELPESIRAEALAVIASTMVAKDPAFAGGVLDSCVLEIERIANPAYRISALVKLGGIYVKLKDRPRAFAAYERALADTTPLWASDSSTRRANVASRDTWPSTQAARTAVHEAALTLGTEAEPLLSQIPAPDLAVLARIQMARALLGLTLDIHNINVRWVEKEK
ncbi:MAG TPA: hypothetical protein VHN20_16150 [Beijerinckiaceae bacterium]|nr:hypothetical protein [Beijerinckiaceae bacterium]